MSDPKRMSDMGDEMGESLRAMRHLAPPDGHADRVADAVADAFFGGAPPDGDGGEGSGGDAPSPDLPPDAASPASSSLSTYAVAGVVAAAAMGGVFYLSQPAEPSPEPTRPSATHDVTRPPSAMPSATPAPSSTSGELEPTPTPSPSATATPTSMPPTPSPTARPSATTEPSASPPSEISLLRDAQAALGSNPQQALALCQQHAALYPAGALSQEREVIVIEALMRLGRTAEAKSRARAFIAAHPGSTHARRLEVLTSVTKPAP